MSTATRPARLRASSAAAPRGRPRWGEGWSHNPIGRLEVIVVVLYGHLVASRFTY